MCDTADLKAGTSSPSCDGDRQCKWDTKGERSCLSPLAQRTNFGGFQPFNGCSFSTICICLDLSTGFTYFVTLR